ncbi:MAG: hypothetical protein K0B02_01750 [DPANN group archaeon]|nr:hypothetical protein [DPANN group archaeon]
MDNDYEIKKDVAIYVMNLTDIKPGKSFNVIQMYDMFKDFCEFNFIVEEKNIAILNKLVNTEIISKVNDDVYFMNSDYAPYINCEIGTNSIINVIRFIFPGLNYKYVSKKKLFRKKKEIAPFFNDRIKHLTKLTRDYYRYYKESKNLDLETALTHLKYGFYRTQILRDHEILRDNNFVTEILFYYNNGLYIKALKSADLIQDNKFVLNEARDELLDIIQTTYDDAVNHKLKINVAFLDKIKTVLGP